MAPSKSERVNEAFEKAHKAKKEKAKKDAKETEKKAKALAKAVKAQEEAVEPTPVVKKPRGRPPKEKAVKETVEARMERMEAMIQAMMAQKVELDQKAEKKEKKAKKHHKKVQRNTPKPQKTTPTVVTITRKTNDVPLEKVHIYLIARVSSVMQLPKAKEGEKEIVIDSLETQIRIMRENLIQYFAGKAIPVFHIASYTATAQNTDGLKKQLRMMFPAQRTIKTLRKLKERDLYVAFKDVSRMSRGGTESSFEVLSLLDKYFNHLYFANTDTMYHLRDIPTILVENDFTTHMAEARIEGKSISERIKTVAKSAPRRFQILVGNKRVNVPELLRLARAIYMAVEARTETGKLFTVGTLADVFSMAGVQLFTLAPDAKSTYIRSDEDPPKNCTDPASMYHTEICEALNSYCIAVDGKPLSWTPVSLKTWARHYQDYFKSDPQIVGEVNHLHEREAIAQPKKSKK